MDCSFCTLRTHTHTHIHTHTHTHTHCRHTCSTHSLASLSFSHRLVLPFTHTHTHQRPLLLTAGPEEAVVTCGPASLQHRSTQAAKLNTNSLPLQINGTPFLSFPLPSLPSSTPVSSSSPLVQHHRRTTYSLPSGAGSITYDGAQTLTSHCYLTCVYI